MLRRSLLSVPLLWSLAGFCDAEGGKQILVAYFTWYENTFRDKIKPSDIDQTSGASLQEPGQVTYLARWIGQTAGAPVLPIKVVNPYPTNFDECLDQAVEEKTKRFRPELRPEIIFPEFDLLFLGFPNWSYTLPMAVCSFLENQNTVGKMIAPFCVHGTGGFARTLSELRRSAPKAHVLRPFGCEREDVENSRKAVEDWAGKILSQFRKGLS